MTAYAIGLDIGIASVGWAAVGLDINERPYTILGMGSRIFTAAENPKTGASLAAPRRDARSMRRRLRRQRHRNERIRGLMLRSGLLTNEELENLFEGPLSDVYALRVEALDRPLTNTELARVLIHISQRRGFRSNRKGGASKEDGELLAATKANAERMAAAGYRTVAEMLVKDATFKDHRRNKGGEYLTTVTRAMIEDEVDRIFEAQRKFGNARASEEFQTEYKEILLSQRSFDEGPGGKSPYGGNQIENMIGKCTFFPEEPRAAKATYTFQYFELLQKVNHIRLKEIGSSTEEPLSDWERKQLVELAKKVDGLTYERIRKELRIPNSKAFTGIRYSEDNAEKKEKLKCMRAWHEMRKALDKVGKDKINELSVEQLDAIGTVLSIYKTSEKIRAGLAAKGIPADVIDALDNAGLSFTKLGHLSLKALKMIIPGLEQGLTYDAACAAAGIDHRAHTGTDGKSMLLHPKAEDYEDITSPVVKRAVAQTIKVINAIIRKQGCSPTYINIELARELSKNFDERNKMSKRMEENRARNEKLVEKIKELYHKQLPSGMDIMKLKLYELQQGVCAYSMKNIDAERLFEPNYVEIDHIIPYSRCFDDSLNNKVLVLAKENREKGNRLPLEYLEGTRRENFKVWAERQPWRKRQNLLRETYTKDDEQKFKERNLQDTKYMASFLMNYIKDNLAFAPSDKRKKRVTAVNGAVTAHMRKRWGITKIREDGDLHHAVDALVIACTTDGMIQQVSKYAAYRECEYVQTETASLAVDPNTGEILREFPKPWPHFYEDCFNFVDTCFVSRMPNYKVTGPAHEETVRSAKAAADGLLVTRVPLTKLKLDKKSGEIAGYYRPELDSSLYEGLKAQLKKFGGDGKKAFAEPFPKPGNPDKIVKQVRLTEKSTLNIPVHEGTGRADNGSMVRVDVFRKDGKYYLVPIYVSDTLKPELPNRAVTRRKTYDEWIRMDEKDFLFSLYPNDLFFVRGKDEIKLAKKFKESSLPPEEQATFLYFVSMDISDSSITCINHDNSYWKKSLGVKTLECFEKYTVDILGEYHKVEKETRRQFNRKED